MADEILVDENIVRAEWGCPECGERRVDWLIWVDDVMVECQTCGMPYDPAEGANNDAYRASGPVRAARG